jgi:hypothetical protein
MFPILLRLVQQFQGLALCFFSWMFSALKSQMSQKATTHTEKA